MDEYGFLVPACGDRLIAQLLAGGELHMTKVLVGSGRIPEGTDPYDLVELLEPVAEATSTPPVVTGNTVSMMVEYRSDLNGGLKEDFWLREFGVYAEDPVAGEVLLYYGNLGSKPQPVSAYIDNRVDVRRFPVKIIVHSGTHVTIDWVPGAWLTAEDIEAHDKDPMAHPDLHPNTRIATVEHGLGILPLAALFPAESAMGAGGFGEGAFGGELGLGIPVRLHPVDWNTAHVMAPKRYAGFSLVGRLTGDMFALSSPDSSTTLTLVLR